MWRKTFNDFNAYSSFYFILLMVIQLSSLNCDLSIIIKKLAKKLANFRKQCRSFSFFRCS